MASELSAPDELAAILHNVGDGITVQSAAGNLVYANDAAARLCGLESADEMLGLTGPELLQRFEIIGEDRRPLPVDRLPNRRAFVDREPREGRLGYRILPGGEERWSIVRSSPILEADGSVRLMINVFHDVTEELLAQERMHFLAEAGTLLAGSLDYEATLADLARLLVPQVADYCIVDAVADGGGLRQVVISHRDPEREEHHPRGERHRPLAPGPGETGSDELDPCGDDQREEDSFAVPRYPPGQRVREDEREDLQQDAQQGTGDQDVEGDRERRPAGLGHAGTIGNVPRPWGAPANGTPRAGERADDEAPDPPRSEELGLVVRWAILGSNQ